MQESFDKKKHTLSSENRESVEMTGINDVFSFNEEEINASCDWGNILIKGSKLLVEVLDLENGVLKVNGKITALVYSEKTTPKNLFGRMFS